MDPRMKQQVQQRQETPSKLSEFFYLFLAFVAIGVIGYLGFLLVSTLFFSQAKTGGRDPEVNTVVTVDNTVELIDANDGSICTGFEEKTEGLFESFTVDRNWYLIGDEFTPEQKRINVSTTLSKQLDEVSKDIKKFDIKFGVLGSITSDSGTSNDQKTFTGFIDISKVEPGVQKVVIIADTSCGKVTSVSRDVNISYPMYVVWTQDWEGKGVPQSYLDQISDISARHGIEMTHFFNPRSLTDSTSEADRQRYLAWVKDRRDNYGDSIGLHLHMFYDLVRDAGLEPQTAPAWGWNNAANEVGYDVIVSGYSYEQMDTILKFSIDIFEQNGLGKPISFRAGGWQANTDTLRALEDNGFLIDSSGRDRFTLGSNNIPVPWLLEPTTQPYRPAYYSQNETDAHPRDQMIIWEFPNNGLDSTANRSDFLYERFLQNYDGNPLTERKTVNYLSHPDYFNYDVNNGVDTLFTLIDNHKYESDLGPVIYKDLDEIYYYWAE